MENVTRNKPRAIILMLSGMIALIYFYTFLHEGGHALISMLYGGTIQEFVLGFNAHVRTTGADFTPAARALFNSAGVLVPVLVLIVTLLLYNKSVANVFYHLFYWMFSVMITSSLLAWVVIPVVSLFSEPPPGDDVTKFMNHSGMSPLLVTAAAVSVIALLAFLIYRTGILGKLKEYKAFMLQKKQQKVV